MKTMVDDEGYRVYEHVFDLVQMIAIQEALRPGSRPIQPLAESCISNTPRR
jgi:hypothetical protein